MIQGQSPDEVQRLARSTQGELNNEIRKHLDALSAMHKQAAEARTAEEIKEIKKRIDAEEKQVEVAAKVMRANEIAANRSANAWKGTLEVMENIATSATFMYGVIANGLGRLKQLGDEVDRLSNVYGALKGSIDEMRDASKGEISDYDLITTKNRALEKELQLTDAQFGAVAAAADNFADALGTDTKEALNQIIDGLATGRVKMLEHAGVVINVDDAYKKYAASIGVAVDQLSDHGKKIAVVRESLKAMDEKLARSGVGVEDFSHKWEKMTAELKNATDQLLLSIGQIAVKIFEMFETTIPRGIRHTIAAVNDLADLLNPLTGFTKGHRLDDEKSFDAIEDKNRAAAADKNARAAAARLAAGTSYDYQQGTVADSINSKKVAQDAKAAEAEALRRQKSADSLDAMFRKGSGINAASLAADASVNTYSSPAGLTAALGAPNTYAMTETIKKAQANKAEVDDKDRMRQDAQAAEAMAKVNDDAMTEMLDKADKLRERAGNGILADLMFGPDGKEKLQDDIETFKDNAADAMGMVTEAGHKMAEALGASLAAFVSGDKNKRASIRDTTHAILESLAAQAYTRAIFEAAEGLSFLAHGNVPSATTAFASAAMFASVGTAAGLSARGIGQSSTASAGAGAKGNSVGAGSGSSGVSSSGSSSFGSGGVRSSGGRGNSDQPVVININSPLGDRAEIGRGVSIALAEYYAQSGRGVPLSPGSV